MLNFMRFVSLYVNHSSDDKMVSIPGSTMAIIQADWWDAGLLG